MRTTMKGLAVAAAAASVLAIPSPASASTDGWISNGHNLYVGSGSHQAWVQAWYSNYACGLKDCASGGWLDARMTTFAGTRGNLNRVREGIKFTGAGISVSVSTSSAGGSFSAYNDACTSTDSSYGTSYSGYARSYTGDWVCHTSTWGWVSSMVASNTGGVRYGSSWYNQPVSASVSLAAV